MAWQPISSAPKRTCVLVWERRAKRARVAINYFDEEGDYWQATDSDGDGCTDEIFPVCWMPLPAKPDLRQFRDAPYPPPVDNRKEWEKFVPSPFAHRWPQDD